MEKEGGKNKTKNKTKKKKNYNRHTKTNKSNKRIPLWYYFICCCDIPRGVSHRLDATDKKKEAIRQGHFKIIPETFFVLGRKNWKRMQSVINGNKCAAILTRNLVIVVLKKNARALNHCSLPLGDNSSRKKRSVSRAMLLLDCCYTIALFCGRRHRIAEFCL